MRTHTFLARTNSVATDTDHLCDHAAQIHPRLVIDTYKLTGGHGKNSGSVARPGGDLAFETLGERAVEFARIEPDPACFESEVNAWPSD